MKCLLITFWVLLSVMPAIAQDSVSDCPKKARAEFRLQANEFSVSAYDAGQGLLALSPKFTLRRISGRPHPLNLVMPDTPIYLPIGPKQFKWWLVDGLGQLELIIDAEKVIVPTVGPTRAPCDRWRVSRIRLQRDRIVLASYQVRKAEALDYKGLISARLVIERGRVENENIRDVGRELAVQCLRESSRYGGAIQGALSLQLDVDLLGRPSPPQIVVDGLVNHHLSRCLKMMFLKSKKLWRGFVPDTRAYLTLYFRKMPRGKAIGSDAAMPIP